MVLSLVLFLPVIAAAQVGVEVSALGMWSTTEDWEGMPFSNEWDSGFNYGAEVNAELLGFLFGGRFFLGDFDVNGVETDLAETWSQTNYEVHGAWQVIGTPLYLMAGYRHWNLDLSESNVTNQDLSFSFDGVGVGGAVKWDQPGSNLFFKVQGMYYFEMDSSLDVLGEKGFDYLLSLRGEIGMELLQGFFGAVGVQFEQVHQDLDPENLVAPYVDYGFEQTSITVRFGYRFSL